LGQEKTRKGEKQGEKKRVGVEERDEMSVVIMLVI
jgi:hypothetical protein